MKDSRLQNQIELNRELHRKIENMQSLIMDLQAPLRSIQNSSNSMVDQCVEERKRLGI